MKHADVFSVLYALSPCCMGMEGDFDEANPAWKRAGDLTSRDQLPVPKSLDDFYTNIFVAMSATFSPNTGRAPFYGDFLYREREGKLERNETVLAQWKSRMPLYMVEDYKKNLLTLRAIFIDYGQKEEFSHIRIASTLFSGALAERGIPHGFEIYEGGTHTNKVKERLETRVFQFFSDKLDFSNPLNNRSSFLMRRRTTHSTGARVSLRFSEASLPQRGYGLQPRVAASATLGTSKKRNFNRNAVASFSQEEMHRADATALRLRTRSLSLPRVAETATLGWRP